LRAHASSKPHPYPLKHKVYCPSRNIRAPSDVTVCIAARCIWNYPQQGGVPAGFGPAVLTLSDRMITFGDVEYEPNQQKVGNLTRNILLLISGDYSIHSQALMDTRKQIGANASISVHDAALIYGHCLQQIKLRAAENDVLAPLGLNTDTFIAQQRDMSPALVETLAMRLQGYSGEYIEALIVGIDVGSDLGSIYHVDNRGTVSCFNDIGFASIGAGAWHAKSRLMQFGYEKNTPFVTALGMTYAAKKSAEVAPGVGKTTDIKIIFRHHVEPLMDATQNKLQELYEEYEKGHQALGVTAIQRLNDWFADPKNWRSDAATSGGDPPAKPSSPTEPAPQT
jgi:20S proteasome alpha/beta subunit